MGMISAMSQTVRPGSVTRTGTGARAAAGPRGGAADELDDVTLARVVRGDEAAARVMVDRYAPRVFALVGRMLPGRDHATLEDLAQDTFLQAFARLAAFDPHGPARLSTWLLTIAARRAIDELRRRPRAEPRAEVERISADTADAETHRRQLRAALERALADLGPELRAAFLLREYHDLSYQDIADALQIELGTVRSRLARARDALRAALTEVAHG